jgi:hypothetical protein
MRTALSSRQFWIALIVCALCAALCQPAFAGEDDESLAVPITYQFNDPNPWVQDSVYSVHQTANTTLMLRHPAREKPRFDKPTWYAGAETDQRLVRVRRAARPVLVKPGAGDFEPGTKERRGRPGHPFYVSYDDIETELVRGDDDREVAGEETRHYKLRVAYKSTRFDADGEVVEQDTHRYEHHLWVAEHLPYAASFALPLRVMGRLFVDNEETRLGEYILDQLRPELVDKGLVLRVEFRPLGHSRPSYVLEADEFEKAEPKATALPSYPIVDDATFARILPLSLVSSMLEPADDEAAAASSFELSVGGDVSADMSGTAVYGTNDSGDFALLMSLPASFGDSSVDDGEELFLLLLRPMHGLPSEGDYSVGNAAGDLDSLSRAEIEEISELFTVMAVVRKPAPDGDHPTVYAMLEVDSGEVEIAEAEEGLSGELRLKLSGIELGEKARAANVEINGTFEAREGLENVGSSQITRVLIRE